MTSLGHIALTHDPSTGKFDSKKLTKDLIAIGMDKV